MPLTKLQFRPGINKEISEYSNEGGWIDGDKIRFRFGYPEKIGGGLNTQAILTLAHPEHYTHGSLWLETDTWDLAQMSNTI